MWKTVQIYYTYQSDSIWGRLSVSVCALKCEGGQPQAVVCTSWEREDYAEEGEEPQVKLLGASRSELRGEKNTTSSYVSSAMASHFLCFTRVYESKGHTRESARLSKHAPVQLCLRNMDDFIRSVKMSRILAEPDHGGRFSLSPSAYLPQI